MGFIVITDQSGQVIAAMFSDESSKQDVKPVIAAQPGQQRHEVDVPEDIRELPVAEQLLAVLEHCVPQGAARLERRQRD